MNRKPNQSFMRLAEHPVTHKVQHVAVFGDKEGALASFPAALNGHQYPRISEVRKMMRN